MVNKEKKAEKLISEITLLATKNNFKLDKATTHTNSINEKIKLTLHFSSIEPLTPKQQKVEKQAAEIKKMLKGNK